jgi:iron(II)-dependent oxidoreductase
MPVRVSTPPIDVLDHVALVEYYQRNRQRSKAIFSLLDDEAYYSQPITLRHPVVFYDGHLPAFSFNTLVKQALGGQSIDARLEALFARGIDPSESDSSSCRFEWPDRRVVQQFADEADRRVLDALNRESLARPGDPLLDRGEAVFTILEHEAMHQETLLYIWHRLPFSAKRRPGGYQPFTGPAAPVQQRLQVPAGRATLGVDRTDVPFGWDNEFPSHTMDVPAFFVDRHNVTNEAFLEFVDAGGYSDPRWWSESDVKWLTGERRRHPLFWERHDGTWFWRGMFELIPLPSSWPVYVSQIEATAFARWRGERLLTEAEYQRAAYGAPDEGGRGRHDAGALLDGGATASGTGRRYPWGGTPPSAEHGVFDFTSWDPHPAGSHPAGQSAWGIHDLVGNGWEWTESPFAPFPGFRAMASYPQYSSDFFDGEHFVMKGASSATALELIRPSFRNWFRPRYPYVYAAFRCAGTVR